MKPPKEKAVELVDKYFREMQFSEFVNDMDASKQCALIAVDEIIKEKEECHKYECNGYDLKYWVEVKQEIIKL